MTRYANQETKNIIAGAVCQILDLPDPESVSRPEPGAEQWEHAHYQERMALFRQKLMIMAFGQLLTEVDARFDEVQRHIIEACVSNLIEKRREKRDRPIRFSNWQDRQGYLSLRAKADLMFSLKYIGESCDDEDIAIIDQCVRKLVDKRKEQ